MGEWVVGRETFQLITRTEEDAQAAKRERSAPPIRGRERMHVQKDSSAVLIEINI
jgi:hypothetical protein